MMFVTSWSFKVLKLKTLLAVLCGTAVYHGTYVWGPPLMMTVDQRGEMSPRSESARLCLAGLGLSAFAWRIYRGPGPRDGPADVHNRAGEWDVGTRPGLCKLKAVIWQSEAELGQERRVSIMLQLRWELENVLGLGNFWINFVYIYIQTSELLSDVGRGAIWSDYLFFMDISK